MAWAVIYHLTIMSYFLMAFMTKKDSRHSSHIMSQRTLAQIKSLFLVPVAGQKKRHPRVITVLRAHFKANAKKMHNECTYFLTKICVSFTLS